MRFIEFKNLPSQETPISAENLNQMQKNVEEVVEKNIQTGREFETGYTLNGNRIYGRYITFFAPSTLNSWDLIQYIDRLKQVISCDLWIMRDESSVYPVPCSYNGEDCTIYVNPKDSGLYLKISYDYLRNGNGRGFIYYTKTT